MTDYLLGLDQKVPGWLIKIKLLEEVETAIRSGVTSRFGIMNLSTKPVVLSLTKETGKEGSAHVSPSFLDHKARTRFPSSILR